MIKNYKLWILESYKEEASLAFPSFFKEMEKEGNCKVLPFKYVMMFDDETNKHLQVFFDVSRQEFTITIKGEFFNGKSYRYDSYSQVLNFVKLYMISVKHSSSEAMFHTLLDIISNRENKDKKFSELKDDFFSLINKVGLKISDNTLEELGITKTFKKSKKFRL